MEFHALLVLSLPILLQDALIVVGASVALLASLAFINLGILLPGLLTSLGGPQPDQRGAGQRGRLGDIALDRGAGLGVGDLVAVPDLLDRVPDLA